MLQHFLFMLFLCSFLQITKLFCRITLVHDTAQPYFILPRNLAFSS